MTKNSQNSGPIDDWTEYKRLVLSELERLNQAVDRLKDQCVEIQTYVQSEINTAKSTLTEKINEFDKSHPDHKHLADFKKELDDLEKSLKLFKKEQQHDATITSKWGFWAAIISIVGSLIVSTISLIVALS